MSTQRTIEEERILARSARRAAREYEVGGREEETSERRVEGRVLGLALFSLGLGAAQIFAPSALARWIGARPKRRTRTSMLAVGLREIACGVGLLGRPSPAWLWARVAGDVMDIGLLAALLTTRSDRKRTVASLGSVLAVAALDAKTALDMSRSGRAIDRGVHVSRAITVNRPRDEVYRFWHDFENLPRFMAHLESVKVANGHSRWKAKGPAGTTIEWEAEIAIDRPNETIAWRSLEGSDVRNQGSVKFLPAPGGRGTEVRVELRYEAPLGRVGAAVAKLFRREPGQEIEGDLRRFKQVIEIGEVIHSDASIHPGKHPARPSEGECEEGQVRR